MSAQALRWHYLGNELVRRGVELDVLTPSIKDIWGFRSLSEHGLHIHRCFAGPFVAFSGWLGSFQRGRSLVPSKIPSPISTPGQRQTPFSEQVYRVVRRGLDHLLLPDVRTEWLPFAWRAAKRLQKWRHYDLVISSHEPGVDLLLGLRAQGKWDVPWIADLADPLLAPYTPAWRLRWDRALEAKVCRNADVVLVTTDAVGISLAERHVVPLDHFILIRQGFDGHWSDNNLPAPPWPNDRMILLFTGTFYRGFRDPGPLIEALAGVEGIYTVFVGDMGSFAPQLIQLGERVLLSGKMPHEVCLSWQRRADILVNLGNTQDDQVPGKIYEYLGAARPILHLSASTADPVPDLLARLRRGRSVPLVAPVIASAIEELRSYWKGGGMEELFDLSLEAVRDYSWTANATRLYKVMQKVIMVPEGKY